MKSNRSHMTAITRSKLSAPMNWLLQHRLIGKDETILDYGCGRGDDMRDLLTKGYDIEGYDPYWQPIEPDETMLYDVVVCNYVLNVIECDREVEEVLSKIKARLKPSGRAYISVRRDIRSGREGYNKRGTYQRTIRLDESEYLKLYNKSGSFCIYEYVADHATKADYAAANNANCTGHSQSVKTECV